jgi:hypothetical protein
MLCGDLKIRKRQGYVCDELALMKLGAPHNPSLE